MDNKLTFAAAGRDLVGYAFHPSNPTGAGILFMHGWESSQNSYRPRAKRVAEDLGVTCLTFDLSGHGESAGLAASFTPRDHLADTIAAFDLLARMDQVHPRRIGVCGASYGAYLAALLIAHRSTKGMLLRAPALHPDSALDIPGSSRKTGAEMHGPAAPLHNLAAFSGPVLIVESEHDEVIPHEVIQAYLDACDQARHALIPSAAHAMTDRRWNRAFVDLLLEWAKAL